MTKKVFTFEGIRSRTFPVKIEAATLNDAVINLIKQIAERCGDWDDGIPFDIMGLDLRGLDLSELKYIEAHEFCESNLNEMNAENVHFSRVSVSDANIENANLKNAHFSKGYMCRTKFTAAHMEKMEIYDTYADNAIFHNTDLSHTRFFSSCLREVVFDGVDLSGVTFKMCNASNVRFKNLKPIHGEIDCFGTVLNEVDFSEVNLNRFILDTAMLKGATLAPGWIMTDENMHMHISDRTDDWNEGTTSIYKCEAGWYVVNNYYQGPGDENFFAAFDKFYRKQIFAETLRKSLMAILLT